MRSRNLKDSAMNVHSTGLQLDGSLHQTELSVFSQNRVTRIWAVFSCVPMLDRMKIDGNLRIAMINFEMNELGPCFRVRVTPLLAFLSNLFVVV